MKKILVAVEERFGKWIARELTGEYKVCCCVDERSALEQLERLRPDGLVVDLTDFRGMDVLHNAIHKPAVIVVLTPLINDRILEELEKQGAAYVFTTPCKVSSVVSTLKSLLEENQLVGRK